MASIRSSRLSGRPESQLEPAIRSESRLQPTFGVPASAGVVRRSSGVRFSPCSSSSFSRAFALEGNIAAAPVRSSRFSRAFAESSTFRPRRCSFADAHASGSPCSSSRFSGAFVVEGDVAAISVRSTGFSRAFARKTGGLEINSFSLYGCCCRSSRRDRLVVAQHFSAGNPAAQELTFLLLLFSPGGTTEPLAAELSLHGGATGLCGGDPDAPGERETAVEKLPGNARTESYRLVGSAKQGCGNHRPTHVLQTTPVSRQNREIARTMDSEIGPVGSRPNVLPSRPSETNAMPCPENTRTRPRRFGLPEAIGPGPPGW